MTLKVDVESVDSLRCRLAIEVPAETVSAELEHAYAALARTAKVPGFRPGRVPRPVLERLFGDRVRAEVFGKLIQNSYVTAIEERNIEAVGQPEIVTEQRETGAALRYSATVEVKPEVTAEHYLGIEVERPLALVTDDDVAAFVERLRQSFAQLHPITARSQVERGDVVTLDYEALVEGRLLSRGENRDVEMGANRFPLGFDAQVIGACIGMPLDFAIAYPADHEAAELRGKSVRFRVALRKLARKELPALDDEFAKDHGECATLDQLRQRVRTQLENETAQNADEAVRRALIEELGKRNEVPVPNAMLQRRLEALIDDVRRDWQQQRIRPKNEPEVLARVRHELEPRAFEQVKIALLLEAIARHEEISITESDVDGRIEALAAAAASGAERVRALYQNEEARRQVRVGLLQSRALDVVVERARITTVRVTRNVAEVAENG